MNEVKISIDELKKLLFAGWSATGNDYNLMKIAQEKLFKMATDKNGVFSVKAFRTLWDDTEFIQKWKKDKYDKYNYDFHNFNPLKEDYGYIFLGSANDEYVILNLRDWEDEEGGTQN